MIEDAVHDHAHRGREEVGGHDDAEKDLFLGIGNRHEVIINRPTVWTNGQSKGQPDQRGHEGQDGLVFISPTTFDNKCPNRKYKFINQKTIFF